MLDIPELILDKLNTLVLVADENGNVEYISDSVRQMLGFEPDQLTGNNWWKRTRFTEEEGILVKNKIRELLVHEGQQASSVFEHKLKTAYGGMKWIRWNTSFMEHNKIVGIGYDITEKKLVEQRLLESNRNLEQKNKDITDSLLYAQRLQAAILPDVNLLRRNFSGAFVLYEPKDIVSGDYYWFYETSDQLFLAAIDCTGHGVPGAMMSMVANSIFKEVFINQELTSPAEIMYALDKELFKALNGNGAEEIKNDGMDVALCAIDKKTLRLSYTGAFRPLFVCHNGEINEWRGSRFPLGFYSNTEKTFEEQQVQLHVGDTIYLSTDGYSDQFGGEQARKLNRKNFRELLLQASEMEINDQPSFLEYAHRNWKQDNEQTDDLLVIGLKI